MRRLRGSGAVAVHLAFAIIYPADLVHWYYQSGGRIVHNECICIIDYAHALDLSIATLAALFVSIKGVASACAKTAATRRPNPGAQNISGS